MATVNTIMSYRIPLHDFILLLLTHDRNQPTYRYAVILWLGIGGNCMVVMYEINRHADAPLFQGSAFRQTVLESCTKSADMPTYRHLTSGTCFSYWRWGITEITRHTDAPLFPKCAHIYSAIRTCTKPADIPTCRHYTLSTCFFCWRCDMTEISRHTDMPLLHEYALCKLYSSHWSHVKCTDTPTCRYLTGSSCVLFWRCDMTKISRHTDVLLFHE